MKLIKINTDHYVIVDDSEIKKDGYVFLSDEIYYVTELNEDFIILDNQNMNSHIGVECERYNLIKKITHSTQPIERPDGVPMFLYLNVKELSLQEVKELIGEVDVEKKVKEYYEEDTTLNNPSSFKAGYNQALEDNKKKKYTAEDMLTIRNQLVTILPVGNVTAWDMIQAVSKYTKWFDDYVESLYKPQTEWEVELIDNKLKLKL